MLRRNGSYRNRKDIWKLSGTPFWSSGIARAAFVTTALGAFTAHPISAQTSLDLANEAWEAGDYVTALTAFQQILRSSASAENHRDIALTTGELFVTTELAADGTAPRWSANGQWIAYEALANDQRITRLVRTRAPDVVAHEVDGFNLTFDPSSDRAAFIHIDSGPDHDAARAAARSNLEIRDVRSFRQLQRALARVDAEYSTITLVTLTEGQATRIPTGGIAIYELVWGMGGTLFFTGHPAGNPDAMQVYSVGPGGAPEVVTTAPGPKLDLRRVSTDVIAYTVDDDHFALVPVSSGAPRVVNGNSPAFSSDGSTVVFLRETEASTALYALRVTRGGEPVAIYQSENELANPALSPSGRRAIVQEMIRENWELMAVETDGSSARRVTWEVQHDLFPQFLSDSQVFAVIGEGRHRRSYIHDIETGVRTRVFHNNTVRTVAPEYEWAISPDATRVVTVAERDGDTISPERGVYLTDLSSQVSTDALLARIASNLERERELRTNGVTMFAPIRDEVEAVVATVATSRIYGYAADLFAFGSKFITEPGNALAIEYITNKLRSFGYEPELQWFEPRPGLRSANIIATLPGTVDPDLIYVVSSHFDSVNRGPGADDNSSGTTALLEAARVLRDHPQRATIEFAFFTGEEAGLLGSREFVRRAVEAGDRIVGALNNDMVGYANDHRLDNTIRYSNAGIRDLQHAAASLFTNLITYDAKYYKSTDAHAYYDAYGDIVGGIGSYPILGNPHYHQSHDVLETINQQLVAEVSKTTVASLMLLASSPSRINDVALRRNGRDAVLTWTPAPETGVQEYVVQVGSRVLNVTDHQVVVTDVQPDEEIRVRAVGAGGLHSWDWGYPNGTGPG